MFIKKFKILAICVLCLNINVQARSVTRMDDVYITRSKDKWVCDRIECPMDAFRCFVSKSNEENPSVLKRINTCYTKDNQVLVKQEFESPTDPRSRIRGQVTYLSNDDVITAPNGLENYDDEKFKAQMKEEFDKMQADMAADMAAEMKNLHDDLQKMKEEINRDIQYEMRDWQHDLSEMQYDFDHMFD
ncbi:uncharacterized protein LOC119606179 [Lucilia sericata]|uniref:uncharacterized protein LOC119606179 n=1 Tax=Lucilia sericata TaxID=13632 RepID=UPI0018A7F7BC|nr:uncharacterized protein LOC119606179 [Lucilia sericata]